MMQSKKQNPSLAKKVGGFIFALTILETPAFFAVYAITGRTYDGSESSPIYAIYMAFLLVVQIFFLARKRRIRIIEFRWLLVPLLFLGMAYLFAGLKHETVDTSIVKNIILWQYTGICLAINVNSYELEGEIRNSLVILMIIITLGSASSVLIPFLKGRSIYSIAGYSLTGNTFQAQSYYIALSAGVNLFFFASLTRSKATKIVSYALLAIQFACALLYAGRGGMILALAYFIAFYYLNLRSVTGALNKLLLIMVYVSTFIILFFLLAEIVNSNPTLQQRFGRLFSYIGTSGIDMSQTSNRDIVYSEALEHIGRSPMFGYGILGYKYLDGLNRYPHNIALEMLIEGGIVYLLLWTLVIIIGYRRIKRSSNGTTNILFLIPFMFAFVKLMFSGSYSYEMLFWFSIVYSYVYVNKDKQSKDRVSTFP